MRKDTYVYELDGNLYINLTNRCSNTCNFCVRNGKEEYFGHKLWLSREPQAEELLELIGDPKGYRQIVFCGFGEPTYRVDAIVRIGTALKEKGAFIRLNTNGQGNLINGYDITPKLKGAVDKVNVSLNESDGEKYQHLCKSEFGKESFDALLDFAVKCKEQGIETVLSVVDVIGKESLEKCQKLADGRGIPLRIRKHIS